MTDDLTQLPIANKDRLQEFTPGAGKVIAALIEPLSTMRGNRSMLDFALKALENTRILENQMKAFLKAKGVALPQRQAMPATVADLTSLSLTDYDNAVMEPLVTYLGTMSYERVLLELFYTAESVWQMAVAWLNSTGNWHNVSYSWNSDPADDSTPYGKFTMALCNPYREGMQAGPGQVVAWHYLERVSWLAYLMQKVGRPLNYVHSFVGLPLPSVDGTVPPWPTPASDEVQSLDADGVEVVSGFLDRQHHVSQIEGGPVTYLDLAMRIDALAEYAVGVMGGIVTKLDADADTIDDGMTPVDVD